MPFKQDPAGRPWVEKVSRTLELIIPFKNNLATLMAWWEENWDKLDVWAESILKKLDTKMDKKNPVYEGTLNGFKTDYLTIPASVINTDTRVQIVSKMQEKHLFTYKTDDNIFPNALPSTAYKKGVLEVVKVTNTIAYFTYKEDGEVGDTIYTSAFNNGKVTEWTANKGDGYNSIPSGGSANKFLKWAASGVAQWANVTWGDITGKPANYNPPVATSTVLGGIKTGNSLSIVNEVLDVKYDTNGIGKALGSDGNPSIYIEDGGIHKYDDVFLSKHNPGEFRCKVANSDNYINGDKWIRIDDYTNASKLENLNTVEHLSVSLNPNFTVGGAYLTRVGNTMTLTMHDIYPLSPTVPEVTMVASFELRYAPVSIIENSSCVLSGNYENSRRFTIYTNGIITLTGNGSGYISVDYHTISATWGIPLGRL